MKVNKMERYNKKRAALKEKKYNRIQKHHSKCMKTMSKELSTIDCMKKFECSYFTVRRALLMNLK